MTKKFRIPERGPRRRRASGVRLSLQRSGLDIDTRGFAVPPRVEGGKPRWQWLMRVDQADGTRRCAYLYAETFSEAEIIADRVAEEWRIGATAADVEAATVAEAAHTVKRWTLRMTFEHWFTSRDESDGALSDAARNDYRAQFNRELAKPLGERPVAELTDDDIRRWKKGLYGFRRQNGSQGRRMTRSVQRYARLLRTLLRYARDQGELAKIPGDAVLKMKLKRVSDGGDMREHYPLSDDQLAALLAAIDRRASPAVAMACRVASVVGTRDQELTHLLCEHLVLDGDIPHLWIRSHPCDCLECVRDRRGTWTSKTRRERKVPLPPELVTELRSYLRAREQQLVGRDSQHVFPRWERTRRTGAGAIIERASFNDAVRAAVATVGIVVDPTRQLLTFHTLRSVAATNLDLRSNGNVTAVSLALGHMLLGQQDRYNRLRDRLPDLYAALYPDVVRLKVMRGSGTQKIA